VNAFELRNQPVTKFFDALRADMKRHDDYVLIDGRQLAIQPGSVSPTVTRAAVGL
jgi:hypothetical protein